ncbi:hypothetical protein JQS43_02445 [Natronosporangium hydrolyticum]|uniref:Helix-turn-helix domain-containing protein n=1 Tax=Natronosporangium hydrolyticum TaxID=2811111 RepID=A0A895YBQ6_9ACTN|nr:helix-turn-helix domain-containing protein [Natronosporangium hydrolyticum]QSB15244.1 hypothetical protein JQS43_02445 [Natronosporangium hydrolyticum]
MAGSLDMDALVPAWFACRLLGIPKQTFRSWVSSGKLTPVADADDGHPLYRYGDVLEVERATRQSRKSSRNPHRGAEPNHP